MKPKRFRAFRCRNYRMYFVGQSISLIGTWMQRTAVYWVVFVDTHSSIMVGLTAFAIQFPSFLLSLFGGVVSDRYNHYRVLLTTQTASLVQSLLLASLFLFNHYAVWEIQALSVLLGIINAFDVPARQSVFYDMVEDKDDLPNAIALNASMLNIARLLGPAIAGILLIKLNAGIIFLINSASFLAVIMALSLMKFQRPPRIRHTKKIITELREGFAYLKATPKIGFVISFLCIMSLLVLPFSTLLPVYAKEIFKGSSRTFGYLNSFIGLGAIAGTFFFVSLKPGTDLKRILLITTLVLGTGLVLFSHTDIFQIACIFAIIMGFGMMALVTISNTIIQTSVSSYMRGRVISYFAMAFFGMQPMGSLFIGWLSHQIGPPDTILAEGIAAIGVFSVFLFFMRKEIFHHRHKEEHELDHPALEAVHYH